MSGTCSPAARVPVWPRLAPAHCRGADLLNIPAFARAQAFRASFVADDPKWPLQKLPKVCAHRLDHPLGRRHHDRRRENWRQSALQAVETVLMLLVLLRFRCAASHQLNALPLCICTLRVSQAR